MRFKANMCGARITLDVVFDRDRMQRITSPDVPELDLWVADLDSPEIAALLRSYVGFWLAYRPESHPVERHEIDLPRDV